MKITDPAKTSTIEEFVEFKDDSSVSYNNLSFRDRYDYIIYPIMNIIDDYFDELMNIAVDVKLTEEEYLKYRYRPKLLAKDVYDNIELDFIILRINGICNDKEFDSYNIKLVNPTDLDNFITSIYNSNKNDLDLYNSWTYNTTS